MARKGQGSEMLHDWQGGIGGEDFLRSVVEQVVCKCQSKLLITHKSFPDRQPAPMSVC